MPPHIDALQGAHLKPPACPLTAWQPQGAQLVTCHLTERVWELWLWSSLGSMFFMLGTEHCSEACYPTHVVHSSIIDWICCTLQVQNNAARWG